MSDSYDAIYAAVRSRISGGNIGEIVREVLLQNCDFSTASMHMLQIVQQIEYAYTRPSAVYKPTVEQDGNKWLALYGENLQVGVCGFGDTPEAAMLAFDKAWHASLTPKEAPDAG